MRAAMCACRKRSRTPWRGSQANPVVTGWFPKGFAEIYVKHKEGEIAFLKGRNQAEICAAYEEVY